MLIGREKVIEYIRLNKSPYWDIRKTDQGAIIVPGPQDDAVNIEQSIEHLTHALELLGPGVYHITCKPEKNTNSRLLLKSNFKIPLEEGGAGHVPAAVGMLNEDEVEKRAREKFDALMREQELKELKERVNELDNGLSKVLVRLEPFVPALIEGILGGKIRPRENVPVEDAQVAGISTDDEAQVRLERAFEKWYELEKDVDPVELVEKIVDMAENNPGMYATAKRMLMGK